MFELLENWFWPHLHELKIENKRYQIQTEGNLESVTAIFVGPRDKHATPSKVHSDCK